MILVTGGCGYIGSHIVKALTDAGEQVVVYDDLSHGARSALLCGEELVVGDICDSMALRQLFAGHDIEAIIHCAALVSAKESIDQPALYQRVNDLGSRHVWEEATMAGVKILLYASSAAVYGDPVSTTPIKESAPLMPTNPYGLTKLAGEQSLQTLISPDARYGIFRFFNVGGSEDQGRLAQSKSSRAIVQRLFAVAGGQDKQVVISGHDYDTPDGTVMRDFVHVTDIARAYVLALKYLRLGKPSFILNLGSGQAHTIGEVIKAVESVTGQKIPLKYGPRIKGDISYSLADIHLAKQLLGWEPGAPLSTIVYDGWRAYVQSNS